MKAKVEPFEVEVESKAASEFDVLTRGPLALPRPLVTGAATVRFHGFDLDEQPLVAGLPGVEHELIAARSTIALASADVGAILVVVCEGGDVFRPIVIGRVLPPPVPTRAAPPEALAEADGERVVVDAEREIVLRCGDSSITLTRAGKVIIKGRYIVSQSSGYNKIKGAAVDIN